MAQPKGFGLGPLSRKRKASGSPGPVPIKVANFSNAKLLMDYTEELDEVDQETSIVFNSVGDVGEYDISVLGSAVQDDHGNPAFYLSGLDSVKKDGGIEAADKTAIRSVWEPGSISDAAPGSIAKVPIR
ncbi:hypothetical protein MferCBS49748_000803 [Microsporum ferrugineum]